MVYRADNVDSIVFMRKGILINIYDVISIVNPKSEKKKIVTIAIYIKSIKRYDISYSKTQKIF